MLRALIRRSALSALILFLVSALVFVATEVLPGDALDVSLRTEDTATLSVEQIEAMRRELGLDRPALVRYLEWIGGILRGDFGRTIVDRAPVIELIALPLRNSAILASVITLIAIPTVLFIGVVSAYWHGRSADAVVSTTSIVGYSIPDFVIGNVLIILFAVWIPLYPAAITVFTNAPASEL
jgi:peptide/nickel transport system permease protein